MRYLLLGAATIALSGCSFLGLGHGKQHPTYNQNTGYYGQQAHKKQSSCHSGNCLSRWNVEGGIGTDFTMFGTAVTGDDVTAPGTNINKIKMNDAYDEGYRAELGTSYALSPNRKVVAMGHFSEIDSAGRRDWGTVGGQELSGALSDYKSYGAELGLRQYFAPNRGAWPIGNIRGYVEGRVGATKVKDINIQGATLGGAALSANDIAFYDGGWVPTAAGLVGVETPIAKYMTLGVESGIRYTGGLDGDDSQIPAALAEANNGGSRTSIPLMLRGRYRF